MRTVAGHALKGATRRLLGVLFPVFFILSSRGMLPKMVGGGGGGGRVQDIIFSSLVFFFGTNVTPYLSLLEKWKSFFKM